MGRHAKTTGERMFSHPPFFITIWPGVFDELSDLPVLFAGFGIPHLLTYPAAEKVIFVRLLKNAPAFAEAASRRQADARRPKL